MLSAPGFRSVEIKTRGRRKRQCAEALIKAHQRCHALPGLIEPNLCPLRIVCISDTHNKQPLVPDGHVLIHAGDLTENGSFGEVQTQLRWLASLPHRYKVFVAGNHDVLLDDAFISKYPQRRYGESKTKHDLDWGDVIYLQDEAITLEFPYENRRPTSNSPSLGTRHLTIFGSPWTPKYGISAFQYHPANLDHWETIFNSLDRKPDVIVTHGPPQHHLDQRDFHRAGCPYLAQEIRRIRPRLSVFGHIHVGYGREEWLLDNAQEIHDEILTGWTGWGGVLRLLVAVAWARITYFLCPPQKADFTTLVNAALVAGPDNELKNAPIVVEL
ncbi:hypothetical protein NQ176_g5964 [Zarea fungicola]|uniref:Uncharacterized protein n=1 Tax=Zarea fungicola TaxID=93591 RepID=A0ACC1N6A8_9HYPO|nr:hypothetical protein NQ176_g5964 [Lecanicillium fungicola]